MANTTWRGGLPNSRTGVKGFTLIEMMIAVTLGILLSIGLVALFGATSKTNRSQDAMAQMQENGRYALTRMTNDLRMASRQMFNASGYLSSLPGSNPVVGSSVAPEVYVTSITFPDNGGTAVAKPSGWAANAHWPLSPVYFTQGYECNSGTCSPAVPAGVSPAGLPTVGTDATAGANRINGADVLSVRYLNAMGWSFDKGELTAVCTADGFLTSLTVAPLANNPDAFNFKTDDLAMLVVSGTSVIFQVSVSGQTLTPENNIDASGKVPNCPSSAASEATLYNFTRNFVTVTYYLALDADPNVSGRYIPGLRRRQTDNVAAPAANSADLQDQAIVQGVEQIDFLYGMQWPDGTTSFLTADQVSTFSSATNCPPPPYQYVQNGVAAESGCLWRALKSIEVHVLVDSVNNMYDLTPADMAYQYQKSSSGDFGTTGVGVPAGATTTFATSGLTVGAMMRREFVSLVSVRNYNP